MRIAELVLAQSFLLEKPSSRERMASLRIYLKEEFRWRYTLLEKEVRIGRSRDNHIVLPHPEVSRYETRIQKDGSFYTALMPAPRGLELKLAVAEKTVLKDGDVLQIGVYRLVFEAEEAIENPRDTVTWESTVDLSPPGMPATRGGRCELVVLEGPDKGKRLSIDGGLVTVGRDPRADLVLSDKSVSKSHLEIECGVTGLSLRDVGSTNGTYVEGQSIQSLIVKVGAEIQIGKTSLKVFLEEDEPPEPSPALGRLIGHSLKMKAVYKLIRKAARKDISIVIQGETGTGKELVAKEIHRLSQREKGPFITVDCSAIPKDLIESELFGHEKGAFTNAFAQRKGAFELASGGTVFLDEIGELPLEMQPKLLRILEEKHFKRIGGSEFIQSDFRVIAASNRWLDREVLSGRFREDLLFRLYVLPIVLPPLRDRKEDIPLLIEHFLKGKSVHVPPAVLDKLVAHPWPGNVRELRNVMERGAVMMEENTIKEEDLLFLPGAHHSAPPISWEAGSELTQPESLEEIEKRVILRALKTCGGDKKAVSRILGIARSTLYEKIRQYKLSGKATR